MWGLIIAQLVSLVYTFKTDIVKILAITDLLINLSFVKHNAIQIFTIKVLLV